jgi:predicted ATPase
MLDLFLCHAWPDRQIAVDLAKALRAMGVSVWLDESDVASAPALWLQLQRGVNNARDGLILVSRAFLQSDEGYRHDEAASLLERHRRDPTRRIYVVLHDATHGLAVERLPFLGVLPSLELAGPTGEADYGTLAHRVAELTRELTPTEPDAGFHVPVYPVRMVGREAELRKVVDLVRNNKIVNIRGAPGLGKTRLAAAVSDALVDQFLDRTIWLSLVPVPDEAGLLVALADALQIPNRERSNASKRIHDGLRRMERLLVFNNASHLARAFRRLAWLFIGLDRGRVLTTSQVDLGLPGETPYQLNPLSVSGASSGSVELFLEYAKRVQPGIAPGADELLLIEEICKLRSGHPYAIALDASRLGTHSVQTLFEEIDLSPDEIKKRGPSDDRSFGESIGSSYALLPPQSRKLLRELVVYRHSAPIALARALAGDHVHRSLSRLVEIELVFDRRNPASGELRFEVLEPIRQFVLQTRTKPRDRSRAEEGRLQYALAQAAAANRNLGGLEVREVVTRLGEDVSVFRGAIRWALDNGRAFQALTLALSLFQFWNLRGDFEEGLEWLEETVMAADPIDDATVAAKAQNRIGSFRRLLGDTVGAKGAYEMALQYAEQHDDAWNKAFALNGLGHVAFERDEFDTARAYFEGALEIRRASLLEGVPVSLTNLGDLALAVDHDLDRARKFHEEALEIRVTGSDQPGIPISLLKLAQVYLLDGYVPEAARFLRDAASRFQQIGDFRWLPTLCEAADAIAFRVEQQGDAARARSMAEEFRQRFGLHYQPWRSRLKAQLHGSLPAELPPARPVTEPIGPSDAFQLIASIVENAIRLGDPNQA